MGAFTLRHNKRTGRWPDRLGHTQQCLLNLSIVYRLLPVHRQSKVHTSLDIFRKTGKAVS